MKGQKHTRYWNILIHSIIVMNVIDLISTFIGLRLGFIEEANQVMAYMYTLSPLLFVISKIIAIAFFSIVLLKFLKKLNIVIKILLHISFLLYSYVTYLHITNTIILLIIYNTNYILPI